MESTPSRRRLSQACVSASTLASNSACVANHRLALWAKISPKGLLMGNCDIGFPRFACCMGSSRHVHVRAESVGGPRRIHRRAASPLTSDCLNYWDEMPYLALIQVNEQFGFSFCSLWTKPLDPTLTESRLRGWRAAVSQLISDEKLTSDE